MNKKFKKVIATVSAVAMCTASFISPNAGAIARLIDRDGRTYEDFTALGFSDIVRTAVDDNSYAYYQKNENSVSPVLFYFNVYSNLNEEESDKLSRFLAEKYPLITVEDSGNYNIFGESTKTLDYHEELSFEEQLQIAVDIKNNLNLKCMAIVLASNIMVTEIENTLPEPTLMGDTNCDGEVNISDAVLIMQSITNPSEYQMSIQGIANADVTGDDGITLLDALRIQEMQLGK